MFDVTALGEVLIDFTPSGHSEKGHVLFETNPGGAPANVLVALSRLNMETAFIGKVGHDQFGHLLKGFYKLTTLIQAILYSRKLSIQH